MQPPLILTASLFGLGLVIGVMPAVDDPKMKFTDCPPAVQKTFQAEAPGAKIETVTVEKDEEGDTTYLAEAAVGGKHYSISVLQDGTLSEMNLAVEGDEDVPFDRLPPAVQATFKAEAFGVKVDSVSKDLKYGVTIFEAVVDNKGKTYEIVVAEDGTLVEKVLVIEDEIIDLAKCPTPVQVTFAKHAKNGTVHDVTRYSGIAGHTYETEVNIKGKVYLLEVAESGLLISKSLEASEE